MILRAAKYRLYPNRAQEEFFSKCFGCSRFIWNKMLADKEEYYKQNGKTLNVTPAKYKEEYPFLKEVDPLALANVQLDLKKAYSAWLNGNAGKPRFKSKKKCRASCTTNNQKDTVAVKEDHIRLPKVGLVKARIHRPVPEGATLKSATVSRPASGRYYCSVLFEIREKEKSPRGAVEKYRVIGLDYSSPHFYVDQDGHACDEPHWLTQKEKKLARLSRQLSRKKKGSSNCSRARKKLAIHHEQIASSREDFCHQLSRKTANSCDAVIVEDLSMKAMAGSLHLGKATNDNGFGMFRRFLKYKLEEQGKYMVTVDRYYASTQTCSVCGTKNPETKDLKVRKWTCPVCGTVHDRDRNSAVNLKQEGIRILEEKNVMVL